MLAILNIKTDNITNIISEIMTNFAMFKDELKIKYIDESVW